jgi:tetratricopeptide (TPR) repeat protein
MLKSRRDEAITLLKEGRFGDALPILLALEKDEIKEWVLYYAVGQCYKMSGDLIYARRFLEASRQLNGMNAELAYVLGDVCHLALYYEDAVKAFEDVISLYPDRVAAYNRIGMIYTQIGELDHAMEWYQKGLDRIAYLKSEGVQIDQDEYIYMLNGKMELGFVFPFRKIEDTVDLDPLKAIITNNIGVCYYQRGLYDEAKREFEVSVGLIPEGSSYSDPAYYLKELDEMKSFHKKDHYSNEVSELSS